MIRLTLLRKKYNLTQRRLAQMLGCSYSFISMLESGQREPNKAVLEKIAGYFGVTPEYLLGMDDANMRHEHADELMEIFQSLDVAQRQELMDFAHFLAHKKRIHTNM